MLRFIYFFLICLVFFQFNSAKALQSDWSNGKEVKARIISPLTHNDNRSSFVIGLEYQLEDGWKTYWRSPGDGGFPQKINWDKSQNISNIEILWPTPSEFEILGFQSLGYQKHVTFPLKVLLKNKNKDTFFSFDIDFLTCKNICIPGNAHLELFLPQGESIITEHAFAIEKSLSLVPEKNLDFSNLEKISTKAFRDNNHISIVIEAVSKDFFIDPKFYLDTEYGLPVILPQINYSANYKNTRANFVFNSKLISSNKLNLNIILKDSDKAFELNQNVNVKQTQSILDRNQTTIYIFIIAFIGGLILNIMPCVLPVLSIKLLSILRNVDNKASIRKSFVLTSSGIISSFGLLALILICLRSIGVNIGWGMQFQQPIFLMVIALILGLFALNLLGFFEFRTPTFINSSIFLKLNNADHLKDFFNGFFATILATPCSAPFVGTAITVAFTQSSYIMLGIFLCMGLGMSLPYLFISILPNMITILPKPGAWIQLVKYFLVFLLLATLIWISTILLNHFNKFFIMSATILFILTAFVLKFYRNKFLIIIVASGIFFIFPYLSFFKFDQQIQESDWVDITKVKLIDYIQNDEILFVDITADWCVTCQFNKINVINSLVIREIFNKNNIIKLRGDWTKSDKKIADFLQQHNRFGIPLNVMYSKSYPNGIVLSELLTIKEIIDTLEKIN